MASEGSQAARKRVRLERGLYLRSDGKYEAKFVVDGRDRSRTLRATTKTAARQERAELLVKLGRGERVFADDPTKTLGHLAEEWLETLNVRPRTREAYAYHLERNVLPYFGRKRRPSEITPQRVAAFVAHLRDERKLSGWTQAGAVTALNGLLGHAVWTGLIGSNPVGSVPRGKRPRKTAEEHRFLAPGEVERLLAAMQPAHRPIAYLAVWTGMRQSECLGLQWGDVDLRAGVIHLTAQLSRPKVDKPGERVPLKTDVARTIDLDAALVAFLRERKEQAFAAGRAGASDWIFATASGGPPHYRNVGRAFELAAERAGLNPQGKRRLRFHDLRRTHASLLIEGGCEGPWVARRLGHSVEMLYSTYAGLFSSRSQRDKGLAAIAAARRQV